MLGFSIIEYSEILFGEAGHWSILAAYDDIHFDEASVDT